MAEQKRKSGAPESGDNKSKGGQEQIKKNFEELKNKQILPPTRVVTLFYHCSGAQFTRVVPFDSPLRDGQVVPDHIEPTDKPTGKYR